MRNGERNTMEVIAGTSEELIRRSDAIDALYHYQESVEMGIKSFPLAIKAMNDIPTIEPKRGKWVRAINNCDQAYHNYCSLCREWNGLDVEGWNWTPNFCPNCGADMRGKDDE